MLVLNGNFISSRLKNKNNNKGNNSTQNNLGQNNNPYNEVIYPMRSKIAKLMRNRLKFLLNLD